jgi:hypothetical protein
MLVLIEASAKPNVVAIRSKAGPHFGLQARIRRSAKLSTIMPSLVSGGGLRRQARLLKSFAPAT